MIDLPHGWAWAPLGDLVGPVGSTRPTDLGRSHFRYVDISSVDSSSLSVKDAKEIPAEGAPSRARQLLAEGDTVFSMVRPYLRRIAYVGSALAGEIASTGFCVLRPSGAVSSRFLFHLSTSEKFLQSVVAKQRGVSYPAVRPADILEERVALPPLAEQNRIVEVLEAQLSRLDSAEDSLVSGERKLIRLKNAQLQTLDGFDVPDAARVQIADIAFVGSGATPSRSEPSYWVDGTIPWVTSGDLSQGNISSVKGAITEKALRETSVKLWRPGTLLVAMYGEGKTRGTVAELQISATNNQACAAIDLWDDNVELRPWIRAVLESRYIQIRSESSGGVQPNLSVGKIRSFVIPIPDANTRARLLEELSEIRRATRRLETTIQQIRLRKARLRSTLLAAAFAGQLVDQDPTDEPASVLLSRIAAKPNASLRRRTTRKVPVS